MDNHNITQEHLVNCTCRHCTDKQINHALNATAKHPPHCPYPLHNLTASHPPSCTCNSCAYNGHPRLNTTLPHLNTTLPHLNTTLPHLNTTLPHLYNHTGLPLGDYNLTKRRVDTIMAPQHGGIDPTILTAIGCSILAFGSVVLLFIVFLPIFESWDPELRAHMRDDLEAAAAPADADPASSTTTTTTTTTPASAPQQVPVQHAEPAQGGDLGTHALAPDYTSRPSSPLRPFVHRQSATGNGVGPWWREDLPAYEEIDLAELRLQGRDEGLVGR